MPESDTAALLKRIANRRGKAVRYASVAVEQDVLTLAIARLHQAYDLFDHVAVSFSGGKDSTVCLQLALNVARERKRLPLDVVFFDEEAIPFQTEEYVRRTARQADITLRWYCLPVKHRNACSRLSPWWNPWRKEDAELWVRPLPPEAITSVHGFIVQSDPGKQMNIPESNGLLFPPERYGRVGLLMGVRTQESLMRARTLLSRTQENWITYPDSDWGQVYGNLSKVYPIYDWKTEDVWTAPAKFGWDYNRAYDVMEQAGISVPLQRCSPAYGEEPMRGFAIFKSCFPDIWDRMSMRVPGANGAYLYGRSELFGYGKSPEKPADMSWQDFIVHYLTKFPEHEQEELAKGLKQCIGWHFKKTADPILETVPHPITGLCWKELLNLAVRGDFKERRARSISLKGAKILDLELRPEQAWSRYNQAKAEEGQA